MRSRRPPPPVPATLRGFDELDALKRTLETREAQRLEAEARRQREAQAREREARVFRDALADVQPLAPTGRVRRSPPPVAPLPEQTRRDEIAALAESLSDDIDVERLLDVDERLSFRRPGIGADALKKLRRGHWAMQRALDLHGMRSDEAREAVGQFLAACVRDGLRCVRIIHGKGLGSVDRKPVLKDKVVRWLAQRDTVLAFCEAPPFAGGAGALLVLMRAPDVPLSAPARGGPGGRP
ncbi:MAG: Smr/MutS family protein [Lautropia sp.]